MPRSPPLLLLLWWLLLASAAAASTSLPLRLLAEGNRSASSSTDDDAVACPSQDSVLANETRAVLTTSCPSACFATMLCVYFPAPVVDMCAPAPQRACLRGQQGCAFQCIPGEAVGRTWLLSVFTNASSPDEVRTWGSVLPDVAINASQIGAWVGDDDKTRQVFSVSVTGDERSEPFPAVAFLANKMDTSSMPRGRVVPFQLSPSFLLHRRSLTNIRLQNIPYPSPPSDADTNITFEKLELLLLRNTLLTAWPLPLAKFPMLQGVDLSANRIRKVKPWDVYTNVVLYNLSTNEISEIEKNAFPARLRVLDLSHNPVQLIPNGTLPAALKILYLDDTGLTAIPDDIARMNQLTQLYLDNNLLGEVPQSVLPTASLSTLGLSNCSLRDFPSSITSLKVLTSLNMAKSDLSRTPNFSVLPVTLTTLGLHGCQLQELPEVVRGLTKLTSLSLSDNPRAVSNLAALPDSLRFLNLDKNGLEGLPSRVAQLRQLETLTLRENPLTQLTPGSLPASVRDLSLSNISSKSIGKDTLPSSLTRLSIKDSALEELPSDVRGMQKLLALNITNCQLGAIEFNESVPVAQLDLSNNRLTRLSARIPTLVTLDLSTNAISDFSLTEAPLLETLSLADNNLSAIPASILSFSKLSRLNMSRNPIRNFKPSASQVEFLSKLSVVVFDQEMFAENCSIPETIDLQGYQVCDPRGEQLTGLKGRLSVTLIVVNTCVGTGFAVLIVVLWRRRKLQRLKQQELDSQSASLEKQRLHQSSASIWTDALLLHHRLDASLVEPSMILGSGMFGEVWLASYGSEDVAVKMLKRADREAIEMFVDEIKLVLTLSHPRIVSSVGVMWTKESDIALVTEFMAGGDLRSFLDQTIPSTDGWTAHKVEIALEITEALVYLHSFDPVVIHRDLKSRNVLLDVDMRAKLSDFGVSRFKLDSETMTAGVGTVRWIAPEVLAGQRYDESADIYSLGVIMNEIDTHKLPFAHVMDETGHQQLSDSALAGLLISGSLQCQWTDACPREIRSLAENCTAFEPSERPSSMQVAFQLRRFLTSV